MIITLIFICIFIISLVLLIFAIVKCWDEDIYPYIFGTTCFIGLLGSLICGIWVIVVNVNSYVMAEEYRLKETVKLYQNEKDVLESFHLITEDNKTEFTSDITLEVISTSQYYERVSNYNTKIFEFKTETMAHKYRRTNPWVNWFESPAWDFVTEEYLDNLTYTIGK